MSLPFNRVTCGNAFDVLPTFPEESVDMVMFSPPYISNPCNFNMAMRFIKPLVGRIVVVTQASMAALCLTPCAEAEPPLSSPISSDATSSESN